MELTNAVKSHGMKLPDAIIAAAAITLQATVLTNDQRLLSLSTIATQSLVLK